MERAGDGGNPRVHGGRLVLWIALGAYAGTITAAAATLAWHRYPNDIPPTDIGWAIAMTALYVPLAIATIVGALRWAGGLEHNTAAGDSKY